MPGHRRAAVEIEAKALQPARHGRGCSRDRAACGRGRRNSRRSRARRVGGRETARAPTPSARFSSIRSSGSFQGVARNAASGNFGLTPAWTNSTLAGDIVRTRAREPCRDPVRRRRRAARRACAGGRFAARAAEQFRDDGVAAVAEPDPQRRKRRLRRRRGVEREPHQDFVIAHQRDRLRRADALARRRRRASARRANPGRDRRDRR